VTEMEMHCVIAKRSTLERSEENWCWFDRVFSYLALLSQSEQCIFYKSVQLCSYFLCNGNLIAAISVGITLG